MGCRRGASVEELEELLLTTFDSHNLAHRSLRCIATAELKRNEPGIQELADKYGVPVVYYSSDELNSVFEGRNPPSPLFKNGGAGRPHLMKGGDAPTPRSRVRRLLGMWGVSEPAALLAAGSDELLVPRVKTGRATIAVARLMLSGSQPSLATEAQRSHN
jgi:cobalt-precorrin 5A hydrolase